FEEVCERLPCMGNLLRLLQFLPRASDPSRDACDGSWACRSRLVTGRACGYCGSQELEGGGVAGLCYSPPLETGAGIEPDGSPLQGGHRSIRFLPRSLLKTCFQVFHAITP